MRDRRVLVGVVVALVLALAAARVLSGTGPGGNTRAVAPVEATARAVMTGEAVVCATVEARPVPTGGSVYTRAGARIGATVVAGVCAQLARLPTPYATSLEHLRRSLRSITTPTPVPVP